MRLSFGQKRPAKFNVSFAKSIGEICRRVGTYDNNRTYAVSFRRLEVATIDRNPQILTPPRPRTVRIDQRGTSVRRPPSRSARRRAAQARKDWRQNGENETKRCAPQMKGKKTISVRNTPPYETEIDRFPRGLKSKAKVLRLPAI